MASEKSNLLRRIQILDFALNDAALYLDTHPNDPTALTYYGKYLEMREQAAMEYADKYGPLMQADYDGGPSWRWVESPWPWQKQEEA